MDNPLPLASHRLTHFYAPWWALITPSLEQRKALLAAVAGTVPSLSALPESRLEIVAKTEDPEKRTTASPQLADGFTRVANEILEALARVQISGHGWRLLMAVFRKTYGWDKKSDWISNSKFVELTGLKKQRVSEAMKDLCERNILIRSRVKVGFQKDHTRWQDRPKHKKLRKTGTVKEIRNSLASSNGKTESCYGKPCTQHKLLQKKKDMRSPQTGETPLVGQCEKQKPPTDPGEPKYSEKFLSFWTAYPAREDGRKGSKQEAFVAFNCLSSAEQDNAILAARNFAATNPRFGIKDAVRFLVSGSGKNKIHLYKEHINPERPASQSSTVPEYKRRSA